MSARGCARDAGVVFPALMAGIPVPSPRHVGFVFGVLASHGSLHLGRALYGVVAITMARDPLFVFMV